MAAIFNHTDFWHLSSEAAMNALIKLYRKDFVTFLWVQGIIVCLFTPLIIVGNTFVVYAVWKDPLKNLRRSPSNLILQSVAVADLLVGSIISPMHAYWMFSEAVSQKCALSFHAIHCIASILVGTSLAHLLLLSIDRLFAVVKPLRYKIIMTRRRIHLAISVLWLYFICFGITIFFFENSFFVTSVVFGVQMFISLQITYCIYGFIIYHLRKNYKVWQKRISHGSVYVTQQQLYADREERLAKSLALVIFFSLFFLTPFFVLMCLVYFCVPCYFYGEALLVFSGVEITLCYLNSVCNPFLYCWRLPKYRILLKCYFNTVFRCCTVVKTKYRKRETYETKL